MPKAAPLKSYTDTLEVSPIQLHIAAMVSRKYTWRARGFEDWEDVRQTAYMLLCMILREGKMEDPLGTFGLAFMLNYDLFDWYREKGRVTRKTIMGAPEDRVFRDVATKSLDAPFKSYMIGDEADLEFTIAGKIQAPPDNPVSFEDRDLLREGIARCLTERERRIITGRYILDQTDEDIAAELGVTASRISQLGTRACQKLEAWMREPEPEPAPAPTTVSGQGTGTLGEVRLNVHVEPGELSDRQVQVLQLRAEGRSTAEVASILNLALETVKSHIQNIREVLGVHSFPACVAEGFRRGILT